MSSETSSNLLTPWGFSSEQSTERHEAAFWKLMETNKKLRGAKGSKEMEWDKKTKISPQELEEIVSELI